MTRFLVLCHPRSGSTLLMEALGQHPAVHQGSEIFNPVLEGVADYVDWRKRVMVELFGVQDSYLTQWGYLDDERFDLSRLAARFFDDFNGVKVMYDQLPLGSKAWQYLQSLPDLRVIVLRRNPIASAVSFQTAMQSEVWHLEANDPLPEEQRLVLPTDFLEWFYRHFCAPKASILPLFDPGRILTVDYEDLVGRWGDTLQQVQQHIGLPEEPMSMRFRQRRQKTLPERVINWRELRQQHAEHPVLGPLFKDVEEKGL